MAEASEQGHGGKAAKLAAGWLQGRQGPGDALAKNPVGVPRSSPATPLLVPCIATYNVRRSDPHPAVRAPNEFVVITAGLGAPAAGAGG